ncbi:MAG: acyl-CoA dehydrogenase [Desulfobacteraceae bacterium]|nr:acyl-CoA dehydrogenase family protein [Desulfobacteraceae bacterium]MBC2754763.1 acyl-CoA dehydrogenase [Desulfobacteraceae bacterium]
MDFKLNKSQKEIQKAAWEFARGEFDKEVIIELSKEQKIPDNILKKSGELGFIGIHYSEDVDGGGMGLFEHVLVCETFCRKDSTLGAALMFSGYAAECILRNGEKDLKEKILPQVVDGHLISTGAFLEPKQGYDLTQVRTTAEPDGDDWVINGKKILVPSGSTAGIYVVLCRTDADTSTGGMSLILVEAGRDGISVDNVSQKLGGRMMPFADITFENVRVPGSNLIGKQGSGYALTQNFFTENRIQIAGQALGTAQGAFDRALDYVKQREQFGKKLAQFQITRHKLADMASKIEAARYLTYYTAWCFDNKKIEAQQASMAKMTAARTAMEVTNEAIQLLGGYGYMTEYEVEHFFRDAKQAEIFQGPPAIQKDIIADSVIGKLK